jgi:hypothetical protein
MGTRPDPNPVARNVEMGRSRNARERRGRDVFVFDSGADGREDDGVLIGLPPGVYRFAHRAMQQSGKLLTVRSDG